MVAKFATRARNTSGAVSPDVNLLVDVDLRHRIEELAYYKAEARGFVDGRELEDWIAAEQELLEDEARP